MKNNFFHSISSFAGRALTAILLLACTAGCVKDLDRQPFYEPNTDVVYRDAANYIQVLAKLYVSFNLAGQNTVGAADVTSGPNNDEGEASYMRSYWTLQQIPTDETVVAWNDASLQDLNKINWNSGNVIVRLCYNRIYYTIALCNEFIRETTDAKMAERGIAETNAVLFRQYRAEARFLRALAYYHAMDLYGNVPFVTEADAPGKYLPKQIQRADLFTYIESELKDIEGKVGTPRAPGYGHADQAAVWSLLATLYLNAEVYTGSARYADCLGYCAKVIGSSYSLAPEWRFNFLADNDITAASEIIFPIPSDGQRQQTYGGTTFLVHAQVGNLMSASGFGITNAWAGNRCRRNLPLLFPNFTGTRDKRGIFYTSGQKLEINNLTEFKEGYASVKWRNKTSRNTDGSDPTGTFVDTDFPMFRLADIYLMYAEAHLRGGGGDKALAISYINLLRTRAVADQVTDADFTLDFILDERARELYWEAHRRTDLIRFHKFVEASYLWPFKGGTSGGSDVDPKFLLYPIPASDIVANPGLIQNNGY